jgi:hypothetical protein
MHVFFNIVEEILSHVHKIKQKNHGNDDVYFRGQKRNSYKLLPGLLRPELAKIYKSNLATLENRLYYSFVQYGGHLLQNCKNTWDILFLMQHHGIPTRLLDWSESLFTALYFAIRNSDPMQDSAIWVLDPYALNKKTNINIKRADQNKTIKMEFISFFDIDFPSGYYNYFIDDIFPEYGNFPETIIALGVNPPNPRIVAQKGAFTFHNPKDLRTPLEKLYPDCVKKFVIKKEIFNFAKNFLFNSNVNEFTLFPDLDGLSRYIKNRELG